MIKIAVFADIHGNYDALTAICKDIDKEQIDRIYSLGDNIAIGPEPLETLNLMRSKQILSVMGNHETYYLDIIEKGRTDVSEGELEHQMWIADQVGNAYYDYIKAFPRERILNIYGTTIYLCHYPFNNSQHAPLSFIDFNDSITIDQFQYKEADLYLFGHQHQGLHHTIHDGREFINLESSGATPDHKTSYIIIEVEKILIE